MTVTLRKPTSPEYRAFSNDVKERARNMYPNFTYGEEEVSSCWWLWFLGLSLTLTTRRIGKL